jgi:hypothetical protein
MGNFVKFEFELLRADFFGNFLSLSPVDPMIAGIGRRCFPFESAWLFASHPYCYPAFCYFEQDFILNCRSRLAFRDVREIRGFPDLLKI